MEFIYKYTPPKFNHGNRCGHDPFHPSLYSRPEGKKKTYSMIHEAIQNTQKFYYEPKKYLRSLYESRVKENNGVLQRLSEQRSESREMVASIVAYLIDRLDLSSMTAVKFKNGQKCDISLLDIAADLKANYIRVYRALRLLREAKYITLEYKSHYTKNNNLIKITAVKKISEALFVDLGVSRLKLHTEKHHSSKKVKYGFSDICNSDIPKAAARSKINIEDTPARKNKTLTVSNLCSGIFSNISGDNAIRKYIKEETKKVEQKANIKLEEETIKKTILKAKEYMDLYDEIITTNFKAFKAGKLTDTDIRTALYNRGCCHPELPDWKPPS